jgi:hypothetical protein
MVTKRKLTLRKYDGDDRYSWAVFYADELPIGHRGIVFWGEAKPIVSGCSRPQAADIKRSIEAK